MRDEQPRKDLSFFRPRGETMRGEVRVIKLILAGWLGAIGGFQLLVYLVGHSERWRHLLDLTFFNLPVHFWLTGQFLPLWFIILCGIFNYWMDRHAARTLDGSIRFRVKSSGEEE